MQNTGSLIFLVSYPRTTPLSVDTAKLCSYEGCHWAYSISLYLLLILVDILVEMSLTSIILT
jgi:hypothetical protein